MARSLMHLVRAASLTLFPRPPLRFHSASWYRERAGNPFATVGCASHWLPSHWRILNEKGGSPRLFLFLFLAALSLIFLCSPFFEILCPSYFSLPVVVFVWFSSFFFTERKDGSRARWMSFKRALILSLFIPFLPFCTWSAFCVASVNTFGGRLGLILN